VEITLKNPSNLLLISFHLPKIKVVKEPTLKMIMPWNKIMLPLLLLIVLLEIILLLSLLFLLALPLYPVSFYFPNTLHTYGISFM
jgi:hypothetical protein